MITTKEIAEKLGISRSTVSRVLNNHPHVNKETRERVLQGLKEMHYIPNEAARSLTMKKIKRIAFIGFSEPQYFWEDIRRGITQAEREFSHKGLAIEYFDSNINNPEEQLVLLQNALNNQYDGIIIAPNDPSIMSTIIDDIVDKGIPIVLCNLDIPQSKRTCFIGCNHYVSGQLGGEFFSKVNKEESSVALFTIKDEIEPIKERDRGFLSEIENCKNINLYDIITFDRTGSDIYGKAKSLINTKSVDGIFISIAGLEEVAKAVTEAGLNGNFTLIGYDINPQIESFLNNHAITATIHHYPQKQSYSAIEAIFNILYFDIYPQHSIQYTNLELIMKYNSPITQST